MANLIDSQFLKYISSKRIQNDLSAINQYGALSNGGVTRLALSEEDMKARAYLIRVMEEAGLEVRVDAAGNTFGRKPGLLDLSPVLIGSHLDSVPDGGLYDGTAGVIAALEAVRALQEADIQTKRPIEVVNFTAEESSRFYTATIGTKLITGNIKNNDTKKLIDKDGVSLYEALSEQGFEPEDLETAQIQKGDYHAFIELHIEQGRVLESYNTRIGIVEAIAAPTRFKVKVLGRQDHSGNTPMEMRCDALAAASELILAIEEIARDLAGKHTVATVGYIEAVPGVMNVIPGEANFLLDIRDINDQDKAKAVRAFFRKVKEIEQKRGVQVDCKSITDDKAVTLSPKIVDIIKDSAEKSGYSPRVMHSGAGHDAMNLVPYTDVGMIFIPSKDGISHSIEEYSSLKDITAGAKVIANSIFKLAMEG